MKTFSSELSGACSLCEHHSVQGEGLQIIATIKEPLISQDWPEDCKNNFIYMFFHFFYTPKEGFGGGDHGLKLCFKSLWTFITTILFRRYNKKRYFMPYVCCTWNLILSKTMLKMYFNLWVWGSAGDELRRHSQIRKEVPVYTLLLESPDMIKKMKSRN